MLQIEPYMRWIQRLWPAVLIGAAIVHNLYVSWLKWGDPVVDAGREWMMAARMLFGETLYMDHRNLYGPLAPYLNMLLFRVFGVHLSVLQAAGIMTAILMTVAIYLLSRRFVGRVPSALMATASAYVFGFAHLSPNPSFNFVVPYAYAATYGIVSATLGLLFLVRHVQEGNDRCLAFSIVGLVLAALSKVEVVFPIAAAHVVYLIATPFVRPITRRQIFFYSIGLVVVAGIYGSIATRTGTRLWTDNLGAVMNQGNRAFVLGTMGFNEVFTSLLLLTLSAAILIVVLGLGVAASLFLHRDRSAPIRWTMTALPAAFAFAVYATLGTDLPLRLLPAVTIAFLAVLSWRFRYQPEQRAQILPALLLWVFTAGCLVRLGLQAGAFFYGFYLVPVPFVALGVLLFRDAPSLTGKAVWSRLAIGATGFGIVLGFAAAAFTTSSMFYSQHTMDVETQRGHILLRGEPWQKEVIAYLRKLPSNTRVAVIPQGAGILFLSGVRMAGGLYSYAPMEMSGNYTDDEVVRLFRSNPPDFIVRLTQDPGSFRYTGFGIEYGWETAKWMQMNYMPVAGNREVNIFRYVRARGEWRSFMPAP
jgi:hypothetical protein